MSKRYYLDTSIWLDLMEDRNEPRMPKSDWARKLLGKIVEENSKIIYSDNVLLELSNLGYDKYHIQIMLEQLKQILIFTKASKKQIGRANDLANRRNIPRRDALHALIAKKKKAIMVTFDKHYKELKDIVEVKNTNQLI